MFATGPLSAFQANWNLRTRVPLSRNQLPVASRQIKAGDDALLGLLLPGGHLVGVHAVPAGQLGHCSVLGQGRAGVRDQEATFKRVGQGGEVSRKIDFLN